MAHPSHFDSTSSIGKPPEGVESLLEELQEFLQKWGKRIRKVLTTNELDSVISTIHETINDQLYNHGNPGNLSSQVHRYILTNLSKGPSLKDFAAELGYSYKYCSQLVKAQLGKSFTTYLKGIRIEQAKQYLLEREVPIGQIAKELGFQDQFAFSRFFKQTVGCPPQRFRLRGRPPNKTSKRLPEKIQPTQSNRESLKTHCGPQNLNR